MKICKLYIQNINSLKGEFTLDFESLPLKDCGLFAITGPTGAGKSTILDAISLALYGECPRLGSVSKTTISASGALMSFGTKESITELEFEVKGNRYRARWSIELNRKNNLNDYNHDIYKLPDATALNQKKGETKGIVAHILGIDYTHFSRVILLAQGAFAALIDANKKERFELMEKITGNRLFRALGKAAFEKKKLLETELQLLEAQRGGISLLTEEERSAFQQQLDLILLQGKEVAQEIAHHTQVIDLELRIQNLLKDISALEIQKEQLDTESIVLEPLREINQQYERAEPFTRIYDRKVADEKALKLLEEKATDAQETQQRIALQLQQRNEEIALLLGISSETPSFREKVKALLNTLDDLQRKVLEAGAHFQEIQNRLVISEQTLNKRAEEEGAVKQKIQEIETDYQSLLQFFQESKLLEPAINEQRVWQSRYADYLKTEQDLRLKLKEMGYGKSQEINSFFIQFKEHKEEQLSNARQVTSGMTMEETEKSLSRVQKIMSQLPAMIQVSGAFLKIKSEEKKASIEYSTIQGTLPDLALEENQLSQQLEILNQAIKDIQDSQQKLVQYNNLKDIRESLQKDHPCPVCGSVHHPGIHDYIDSLTEQAKQLLEKESLIQQIQIRSTQVVKSKAGLEERLHSLQINIAEKQQGAKELEAEFQRLNHDLLIHCSIEDRDNLDSILLMEKENQEVLIRQKKSFEEVNKLTDSLSQIKMLEENWNKNADAILLVVEQVRAVLPNEKEKALPQLLEVLETKINQYLEDKARKDSLILEKEKLSATLLEQQKTILIVKEEVLKLQHQVQIALNDLRKNEDELSALPLIDAPANKLLTWNTDWASWDAQLMQSTELLNKLSEEIQIGRKQLDDLFVLFIPQIQDAGFKNQEEFVSALSLKEQAKMARMQLVEWESRMKEIQQRLLDRYQSVESIRPEGYESPDLTILISAREIKSQLRDELLRTHGQINSSLQSDTENRKKLQALENRIDIFRSKMNPWLDLNALIGDALGDKFNNFAQQLSLQRLLMQANANLAEMNSRYELALPENGEDDDALYVIDKYLGNTRRAAGKTLSGGEKFMASLALALGLSDISAGKIDIQNLFIDEGFGSLDSDALNQVLGILENLQQQRGRSIGIISHVQELKERIAVQIQVEPSGGGWSTINCV